MRDLTDEQLGPVQARSGSLLLAAGAGSGKTSVLVERFVRAVLHDAVAPGRILAITFTERAAAELRERVRARFLELGERDAARDTEAAQIGTVHAFCARFLRAHALSAGLDPRFTVLDEPRAVRLRGVAFARSLADFVAGAPDSPAVDLAAAYGADRLALMIVNAHDALRSQGARAPRLPMPSPARTPAAPGEADPSGVALVAAVDRALRELDELTGQAREGRRVLQALERLERARTLLERPATGRGGLLAPSALAGLELPAANGVLSGSACDSYRAALDVLQRRSADHHATAAVGLLDGLLERYARAYAGVKRERATVDFDDLELLARDLLLGDEVVQTSWAERFTLLMVDEFQDINPRQMEVLGALERDNLFTVGDEFQSIYGFRYADVGLFRERRRALAATGASLVLSRNFRGRPQLLEVINAAFAPLFESDFTPLVAGRSDGPSTAAPLVELLITDTQGWEGSGVDVGAGLPPATIWRQAEARLLAQRLAELVAGGEGTAGDMAVLVRATGDIPVYERALEQQGLSTLAAGAGGYWSNQQVGDLLAYLGTLANPLDEQALYGTLACPLVGVSSDALAIIAREARARAAEGRASGGVWAMLVDAFAGQVPHPLRDALAPADRDRLAAFVSRTRDERRRVARHPISELLGRVIAATGYGDHVLTLPWGERRLANVHKLLRLARGYEASEGRDLRGFLDHAARQAEAQAREADAPVEDTELDAVRLMTIHAAKGLEFGIVAVADLGRQGRTDTPDLLVDGSRVGLRLMSLDGSHAVRALEYERLRAERLAAEVREEERILYVAMTRARERLLCSGAANPQRWPAVRPGAPPLSWLGPALGEGLTTRLLGEPRGEVHPPGAPQARVRYELNTPATVGRVLRVDSGAPAGAKPRPPSVLPPPGEPVALRGGGAAPPPLSYTALAEHERCGYRFYLERVLGLPCDEATARAAGEADVSPEGLEGRRRGVLVHRLLESVDYRWGGAPPLPAVTAAANELGVRISEREASAVAALVGAIAGTPLATRLAAAPRVHREHPFAFAPRAGEPLITGVLDVVAHELGGECLIVDYKSDRVGDTDLEELTHRHYEIQRTVYALAALRAGASSVDVVHWYLERPTEPVSAHFLPADDPQLSEALHTRVQAVSDERFEIAARPHRELCLTCPGRRALCRHPESLTLRRLPPAAGATTMISA